MGGNPRGIAFAPNSCKVYLSAESGQRILVYTFATETLRTLIPRLASEPRHLVIDSTGKHLYASLNKGGAVVKIDIARRRVVDRVGTGNQPRTIVLAPDGLSLYVVNYLSQTLTKVRTRRLHVSASSPPPLRAVAAPADPWPPGRSGPSTRRLTRGPLDSAGARQATARGRLRARQSRATVAAACARSASFAHRSQPAADPSRRMRWTAELPAARHPRADCGHRYQGGVTGYDRESRAGDGIDRHHEQALCGRNHEDA